MKTIFAVLVLSFFAQAASADPLRCQGLLTPPAGYPNYAGQVALYFTDGKAKTAKLWHQVLDGSSKMYTMRCESQYVGDGPSNFVCHEDSTDELKFTFTVMGSYARTRPSGLGTSAFIGVERDGEKEGRYDFVASLGTIRCN